MNESQLAAIGVAQESVACNLCGGYETKELYRASDYRFDLDEREWPVVQCIRCSLAYLNPRPTPDTIGFYYPRAYYEGRSPKTAHVRYEAQNAYLNKLHAGRLLDIGCANGDWISILSRRGWDVAGLEPSPHATNPHRLDIRRGRFPGSVGFPDQSFDVITAWAVFEHLHDPLSAFLFASKLLRPGGTLIILVTNIRSVFSRYSYQEDIPRHLYFFSERTLRAFGERTGLTLDCVNHPTDLYGGSGRGALRLRVYQAFGWTRGEYFRHMRLDRIGRLRASPLITSLGIAAGLVEKLVLSDWLVRRLRINGHIVAQFRKHG